MPLDKSSDCECYTAGIAEGDLILLFSDGLRDNLFEREILHIVDRALSPAFGDLLGLLEHCTPPEAIARALALAAQERSLDSTAKVPFVEYSKKHGFDCLGGKQDDITVVAAWVVTDESQFNVGPEVLDVAEVRRRMPIHEAEEEEVVVPVQADPAPWSNGRTPPMQAEEDELPAPVSTGKAEEEAPMEAEEEAPAEAAPASTSNGTVLPEQVPVPEVPVSAALEAPPSAAVAAGTTAAAAPQRGGGTSGGLGAHCQQPLADALVLCTHSWWSHSAGVRILPCGLRAILALRNVARVTLQAQYAEGLQLQELAELKQGRAGSGEVRRVHQHRVAGLQLGPELLEDGVHRVLWKGLQE